MPFHINATDRSLVLEFGVGDLVIGNAHTEGATDDELVIWSNPGNHRIGERNDEAIGKATDEIHTLARMVFHDVRSLDVLIRQALKLKQSMQPQLLTSQEGESVPVSRFAFSEYWISENIISGRISGLTVNEQDALIEYNWRKLLRCADEERF